MLRAPNSCLRCSRAPQAHHKTCVALQQEEEARREADRQMGAQLAALTERLAAVGVASPCAATAPEGSDSQARAAEPTPETISHIIA